MATPTLIEEIPVIVGSVRATYNKGITKNLKWRINQLLQLQKAIKENEKKFLEALHEDLHMDPVVAEIEVTGVFEDIQEAIAKLDKWTQPESSPVPVAAIPGKAQLLKEPYGVILIISPWNYPISLITRPLIVISAGNAVIIKPSEVSKNVEKLVSEIFPKYLDIFAVRFVNGGPFETQALLKEKFDKICYTGSTSVGRIVMKAAAEHLTPVLLELGGKSPVIIDKNTPLDKAVPRIIWGKFLNAGQTCISPDYALVHKDKYDEFLLEAQKVIERFWGKNPQESKDYGRIINEKHLRRLKDMIDSCGTHILTGGKVDESDRYIAPTLITNPSLDSTVMKEEIFGPLFPIIPVQNLDDAINFVNDRPKPLALYIFTPDPAAATLILSSTSSGGAAVNETVLHNICRGLPFGGVGDSGMGGYNGKYSFDEFCHFKGVLYRDLKFDMSVRYPPFSQEKLTKLRRLMAVGKLLPVLKNVVLGLVVVTLGVLLGCWFA